ncbi:MAG: fused MFS/spermidine synthase [Ornithinimicrobium sp.]
MAFAFERDDSGGVTVLLDGHPQSYVHPGDPGLLAFEYVQHLAIVVDVLPAGVVAVTHVGGAGLTLPRYVEHTRPGSPQIVLEPDVALTEAVRREIPLPKRHRIRVRGVGGAEGMTALRTGSADLILVDAYADGQVPAELTGLGWVTEAARVLRPGGLLAMNLADEPGLRHTHRVAATVSTALPNVGLLALNEVFKGKRFGNVVLLASAQPLPEPEFTRRAASAPFPTAWQSATVTARRIAGAQPFGTIGEPSPAPPDPGAWRRR